MNPNIHVYGVSAKNSAALAASMVAGKVVITDHYDTLADGVAGGDGRRQCDLGACHCGY